MVAVVSGAGMGLGRSSAEVLGGAGVLGNSMPGRVSDNVYVNAATGNLVVQRQDEFLIGLGPDSAISRTYNSLGAMSGETDNWGLNVQRTVNGLTGTVNTAGSTITRTDESGTQVLYVYVSSLSAYQTKEGSGAHDRLTFSGSTWTWTEGSSQVTETYDNNNGGRITSASDTEGHSLTYTYNSTTGALSRVTTADGGYTDFVYTGANLTQLTTVSGGVTTNRTRYAYDTEDRLIKVTVDKSPTDGVITDGETYVTNYSYLTGTRRINQVWSDTGSYLSIHYGLVNGEFRVDSLTESVTGVARVTTLSYDTTNRVTTITDPQSQTTAIAYDTSGRLTSVTAAGRTQSFGYDADGNVTSVTDGGGHMTTYGYDNNGNRVWQVDDAGNQTNWTYGTKNERLTERRFLTPDPDGAGAGVAGNAVTTNYVYYDGRRLSFVVSPEGRVTQYGYNAQGQVISVSEYTESVYTGAMAYGAMAVWFAGLADRSATTRTETSYDVRGNVATVANYGKVLTSGNGDNTAATELSKTYYTYSQTGQLLSRQVGYGGPTETFVYDGLGRMIGSTDFLNQSTSIVFNDAYWTSQVVVTLANGSTTTSVYDMAGDLLSTAVAGSGVTTATTSYKYDTLGRVRISIDPAGNKSHILYDAAGRKAADIAADGGLMEYIYDTDDRLVATVAYANKLSSTTLATLVDGSGNPTSVALSSVRPTANANDRWAWNVYDTADRLVETIDGAGTATVFTYDGASQLVSTKVYANALSVSGFKTTPPTSLQLPTANAAADRVTRNFYGNDGLLVGVLDAAGYLTQYIYDGAGLKSESIAYANLTASAYRASGTLANLLSGLASPTTDARTRFVYDGRGILRGTIDATGAVTSFSYDAAGRVNKQTEHATLYTLSTVPTFPDLQTWATGNVSASDRITRTVYDAAGEPRYIVDAEGFVTEKQYLYGQLTKDIRYPAAVSVSDGVTLTGMAALLPGTPPSTAAVTQYAYDSVGRLTGVTDAEGVVTHNVYNVLGQLTDVTQAYGTTDAATTHYVYDVVGQVSSAAMGYGAAEVSTTVYTYDAFGQVTDATTASGTAYAETTHYVYDVRGQVLSVTNAYGATEAATTTSQYDAFGNLVKLTDPRLNPAYYYYDTLGRQILQIDPEGYATQTTYTAHGEIATVKRYYTKTTGAAVGTPPTLTSVPASDATTSFEYDKLGRVLKTIDAVGHDLTGVDRDRHTEFYSYNAFGDRVTVTNKLGGVTTNTYDKRGLLTQESQAIAWTQSNGTAASTTIVNKFEYDARGNQTKSIEAAGQSEERSTNFVYDKLGRLTAQFGSPVTVLNEALVASTATSISLIAYDRRGNISASYVNGALTFHYYDDLNRKTAQVDAAGTLSTWTYDPNGNVMSARVYGDDLGGGSSGPLTSVAQAVLAGQTVTDAAYRDLLGQFTDPNSAILDLFTGDASATAQVYRLYDVALGRLPTASEVTDWLWRLANLHGGSLEGICADILTDSGVQAHLAATGDNTQFINGLYQAAFHRQPTAGEVTYWLGAGWTHAAMLALFCEEPDHKAISTAAFMEALASRTAPAPVNASNYRETTYTYDKNNRRLSASVADLDFTSGYTITGGTVTTYTNYDADGNVVQEIDGQGNSAYDYYDKLGRKKATADREGYVTTYALDAEGNVLTETRYASNVGGLTATVLVTPTTTANDRITIFTYDQNGRRLTEKRTGVVAYTVNATTGNLTAASTDAKIVYTYNGLDEVLTKTEANGEVTAYSYDNSGRLAFSTAPTFTDYASASVARVTEYGYDRLNNVTSERIGLAAPSSTDHVTTYTYGAQGRLATMTDANSAVRHYDYDRAGNVVREWYTRTKSDGSTATEANVFRYDALGRQTFQAKAALSGSSWRVGGTSGVTDLDSQEIRYDAYGEISAKGTNGLWQETFGYDKAGRLVKSTAGDGVTRFFYYDKSGNLSVTVNSAGADLSTYATVDALTAALGSITSPVTGMLLTLTTYNKRGDNLTTLTPHQYLPAAHPWSTTSRTFNAFGEVLSETTIRQDTTVSPSTITNAVTTFTYNTLGKLIEKQNPEVDVTDETGFVTHNYRPTENYYYDLSGRLVGVDDANGNRTTRQLLAGTGYGGSEALVTAEHHPDGGVARTGYDVFGNARKLTNEISKVETRTYDKMGNVLTIAHPGGLVDTYAYDQLGQRLSHGNNMTEFAGHTEKTDYDAQGRITRTADYEGTAITYAYAWSGSLVTSGLATFGGWTKTTNQYGTYTATDKTDIFGRTIGKTDFGGITYNYGFNKAGWLTTQTSTEGQSLTYTYFNTGAVATITDASQASIGLTSLTSYAYDERGNKLKETFSATRSGVTTVFQNATSVYDNMNRRISVTDTARGGETSTYEYDAVGNVRKGEGLWYKYDAMNRVVRQGHFVGTAGSGTIERGTDMLYDAAGQRTRVITTGSVTENVTNYFIAGTPEIYHEPYTETGSFWLRQDELDPDPDPGVVPDDPNDPYDEWAVDIYGNLGQAYIGGPERGPDDSMFYCVDGSRPVAGWTEEATTDHYYTGSVTAPTDMIEIYNYNDAGYLTSVTRTHKHLQGGDEATPVVWTEDTRDLLGRVTEHMEFQPDTSPAVASYRETYTYDLRSNILTKWTGMKRAYGTPYEYSETTFSYLKMQLAGGAWVATGAYQGGAVTGTVTKSWQADSWTEATKNALTSIHYNRADSSARNDLAWRDGARVAYEYSTIGGSIYTSTHTYDKNGFLTSVAVADGEPTTKYLLTDARGQMIQRKTVSGASPGASGLAYFQNPPSGGGFWGSDQTVFRFDGYQFGTAEAPQPQYDGAYAESIDDRYWGRDPEPAQGFFITPQSQPSASARYTVRAGETLASIAAETWGDASLWYVIAEANGLSGSGQVAAGQSLIIPNKAVRTHFNADTFRPYDGSELVGPTGASKPHIDRSSGNCGAVGQVLKLVVAVAVTSLMGPAGSWLMGAFNAVVGDVASQGFGMATGIQDGFSWKEVGLSAIGGGVASKLNQVEAFEGLGDIGGAAARGAAGNAITQGIGVITGLQDDFDFSGVAMAGVMGGVAQWAGGSLFAGVKNADLKTGLSNMAGGLAAAGAKSLIDGTSFGDNVRSVLPSVIANTVGGMVGESIKSAINDKQTVDYLVSNSDLSPLEARALLQDAKRIGVDQAGGVVSHPDIRARRDRLDAIESSVKASGGDKDQKFLEFKAAYEKALIAADVYWDQADNYIIRGYHRLVGSEVAEATKGKLTATDLFDDKSGYYSAIYRSESTGELIYANRGTQFDTAEDRAADILQSIGKSNGQFIAAQRNARILQENGVQVTFVGHSLGGGLATAQSIVSGYRAVVFNPSGVHANTVGGAEMLARQDLLVTNWGVRGELVGKFQDGGKHSVGLMLDALSTPDGGETGTAWRDLAAQVPRAGGVRKAMEPAMMSTIDGSPERYVSVRGLPILALSRHLMPAVLDSMAYRYETGWR